MGEVMLRGTPNFAPASLACYDRMYDVDVWPGHSSLPLPKVT
jgi:hypothetical protein